jgi:hypothetical protein
MDFLHPNQKSAFWIDFSRISSESPGKEADFFDFVYRLELSVQLRFFSANHSHSERKR